jgi:hypothetical protein
MMRVRRCFSLLVLASLIVAPRAFSKSAAVLSYPVADVWSTAVRFIRVDRGYAIREKDDASGYILFDLVEGAKVHKGSLELVSTIDGDGRDSTRAVFSIPDLPRHYEMNLLDKMTVKVREDRGSPAPPPPKRAPDAEKPARDAGALPRPGTSKEFPR